MPTDDFSGSGALGGDWTVNAGSFTQSGGNCYGATNSTSSFAIYTTGSVSDDHESTTVLQPRGSGQYFGPVVRGNTSNAACANVDAGADGLYVSTWSSGGAQTVIVGPITCPAAGTAITLRAVGSDLSLYYDGIEQTGEGSPWTPAGLPATGRYGISAYSNGTGTGASSWTGADVASAFELTPTAALALSGTLSVSGDISAVEPVPFDLTPTAPLALSGTLAVSGDTSYAQPFELDAPIVLSLAGTLGVAGDLSFRVPFELAPTAPLALAGVLAVAGDVASTSAQTTSGGGWGLLSILPERRRKRQRDEDEPQAPAPSPPDLGSPRLRGKTIRASDLTGRVQLQSTSRAAVDAIAKKQRRKRQDEELLLLS